MAGISNTTEDAILKLIFQAVAWTDYAINHTTTPQTNIALSLHTADPLTADTGDASTTEVGYTNYTRVNKTRDSTNWPTTGTGSCSPNSTISFPAGGAGGANLTAAFFATSKSNANPPTGAQPILWSGAVSPSITCGNGVTPQLTATSTITLD